MRIRLQPHLYLLFREVVSRRAPRLTVAYGTRGEVEISRSDLPAVQELLGDELCETGIGADDEPNERGVALEGLIDALSPNH